MKKILSIVLSLSMMLAMLASLTACDNDNSTQDTHTGSSITQSQTDVTDTSSTEQNSDTSSSDTNNSGGSSDTDAPSPTTSALTTITEPETSKPNTPTHTHSYSTATCTTPAKCSCGVTSGNSLDHSWNEATCKAPKTCSVCNITIGEKAAHIYEGVRCKVCNNPLEKISTLSWGIVEKNKDGGYHYTILDFKNNILTNGGGTTKEEVIENDYISSRYKFKLNNVDYVMTYCEVACFNEWDIKKCVEYEDEENITIYPYLYEYVNTDYIKLKRLNQTDLIVVENTAPEWHNFEVGKILKLANIAVN